MAPSEAGLVRRTIWLLRAVAAHPEGVGLSEVAREAGIPKATCYRVLSVLERESWLTLDPVTRRYRVSLGLLSIVGGLLDGGGAYGHMREVLRNLAEETRETAGFDVLLPPKVMVVAQVPGPSLIGQTLKPVPRTQPVWATSTGKVLLAALSSESVRADFTEEFAEHAPPEVGDLESFMGSLEEVRNRGFAFAYDELEVGAASVAAPVRLRANTPYAVWIGGPTYRITRDRIDTMAESVIKAARQLTDLLSNADIDIPSAFARH
ncbi:Acetate operon repressor [Micromonospora sp. MW-13]|uniref:IclR family transcriptional regulator n=1 Tax=unclassified Micromonospora TaxID=2617518 RepID=UPI000EDAF2BF|nr:MULTISPECIES: IclR family transcriptional regulator [unclassified Micromonospora]MCX4471551.1 IclR family transcriptional regulator [Micromonospora sp. NBC_01655]RGC66857.1 Acetate operon repressor [Micromonospora sp. MW-13]